MKWLQTKLEATWPLPSIVIIVGIGLRLLVAKRGHNFDFDSFLIVVDIVKRGGNVYAETTRYNYGPAWFNIIFILDTIASFLHGHFRDFLVGFLSMVDLGIFFVLWRKAGRTAAYLFFLNPVSIIITGYHNQFDNLAILLGLLSVIIFGDDSEKILSPKKQIGLLILGLSLMAKHLLFAFPLWLAVKQKGLFNKIIVIVVPLSVFALGFIPYWKDGQQGIIQNVFMYKSFNNQIFFSWFAPEILSHFVNARMAFLILLGIFSVIFRSRNAFDSLLLYTCIVVATSPAIANQYLAIVIPFIAVYSNVFFYLYTILGMWYLALDESGLHIPAFQPFARSQYYALLVFMLCIGFVWHLYRQDILKFMKKGMIEIRDSFI